MHNSAVEASYAVATVLSFAGNNVASSAPTVSSRSSAVNATIISFRTENLPIHHITYISVPTGSLTAIDTRRRSDHYEQIELSLEKDRPAFHSVDTSLQKLVS